MQSYRKNKIEHNFIYISVTMQKYFIGWNEVVVENDDDDEVDEFIE